jgi:hypothetical protein
VTRAGRERQHQSQKEVVERHGSPRHTERWC